MKEKVNIVMKMTIIAMKPIEKTQKTKLQKQGKTNKHFANKNFIIIISQEISRPRAKQSC